MELVYFALVGLVAGWLAGILMKSSGGVLFDLILGVIGALVGGWVDVWSAGHWNRRTCWCHRHCHGRGGGFAGVIAGD